MDRTRVRVSLWVSRNACWIEEAAGAGLGHSPRVENSPTAAPYAGYDQRVRSGAGTSPPSLARWKPRVYDDDEDDGPLVQYTFRMS